LDSDPGHRPSGGRGKATFFLSDLNMAVAIASASRAATATSSVAASPAAVSVPAARHIAQQVAHSVQRGAAASAATQAGAVMRVSVRGAVRRAGPCGEVPAPLFLVLIGAPRRVDTTRDLVAREICCVSYHQVCAVGAVGAASRCHGHRTGPVLQDLCCSFVSSAWRSGWPSASAVSQASTSISSTRPVGTWGAQLALIASARASQSSAAARRSSMISPLVACDAAGSMPDATGRLPAPNSIDSARARSAAAAAAPCGRESSAAAAAAAGPLSTADGEASAILTVRLGVAAGSDGPGTTLWAVRRDSAANLTLGDPALAGGGYLGVGSAR